MATVKRELQLLLPGVVVFLDGAPRGLQLPAQPPGGLQLPAQPSGGLQ